MPLKTIGVIEIPNWHNSDFDHAAFDVAALTAAHEPHENHIAADATHDWSAAHAGAMTQQHHHGLLV